MSMHAAGFASYVVPHLGAPRPRLPKDGPFVFAFPHEWSQEIDLSVWPPVVESVPYPPLRPARRGPTSRELAAQRARLKRGRQ